MPLGMKTKRALLARNGRDGWRFLAYPLLACLLLSSLMTALTISSSSASTEPPTTSYTANPTADVVTTGWTKGGTCASGYYQCVNDYPDTGGTNYARGPNKANSNIYFNFTNTPNDFVDMASMTVDYYGRKNQSGVSGTADDENVGMYLYQGDVATMMAASSTSDWMTTSWTHYTQTLRPDAGGNKTIWDSAVLKIYGIFYQNAGLDTTTQIDIASVRLTINYRMKGGGLAQVGYIFENDDQASSSTVDSDTAQAAGNTALTNVHKGERMTLRTQLDNSGRAESAPFGLFYDRNDGYFTKVGDGDPPITGTGSCANTNFDCSVIDSTATSGRETAVAVDSNGTPWIAHYENTNSALKVSTYVGSNGTGCGGGNTAWSCVKVQDAGLATGLAADDVGHFPSIAVDAAGKVWVAYADATNNTIMVATNVPSSTCSTGGSSQWTCMRVATSQTLDYTPADALTIALAGNGTPYVSWYNSASGTKKIFVAQFVGGGGSGCYDSSWTGCATTVATGTSTEGGKPSLAFDATGNPWVSWSDGQALKVSSYSGSAWNAAVTIESASKGATSSIAFAPDGNAWIAYYDNTTSNNKLKLAKYVGSGGSNCSSSSAWTCYVVDNTTIGTGYSPNLVFDPAGQAWITYIDSTNHKLRLARNYGSGSCNTGASGWTCSDLTSSNGVPSTNAPPYLKLTTGLAFAPDGTAYVSFPDSSVLLNVAKLRRGGEITVSPANGGNTDGATIAKSHADMSSATDSGNATDADCISGSTTWNNGKWFNSEDGNGLTIPDGTSTHQCTEVAWTIDTSQATASTTYRFVIATADAMAAGRATWRGPASISNYPQLGIESGTTARYSKDALPGGSNCSDTNWTCLGQIDTSASSFGNLISMDVDSSGDPWVAYWDTSANAFRAAQYVGASGSGCGTNAAWTCTVIDTPGHDVTGLSNGFDLKVAPDGTPWVIWYDTNASYEDLHAARYVGSGGTGCTGSTSWTCWSVRNSVGKSGLGPGISFDQSGTPWIVNNTYDDVEVFKYVGTSGSSWQVTGSCMTDSGDWSCEQIDSPGYAGAYGHSSIAFDANGKPWVAFAGNASGWMTLKVAQFVGSGGSGCTSTHWNCTVVENASGFSLNTIAQKIAFDVNGIPWILAIKANGGYSTIYPMIIHYVGSGGFGCAIGGSWDCTNLDTGNTDAGIGSSGLAMDSAGRPWATFNLSGTNVKVANYVGVGGNCPGDSQWNCSTVLGAGYGSWAPSIAFDKSGTPWIADFDTSAARPVVARLKLPPKPLSYASTFPANPSDASNGDLRLRLDSGGVPRGTCSATTGAKGYCGVVTSDSDYDSVTTVANGTPMYALASRSTTNTTLQPFTWIGQSTVAPSASALTMQIYNFNTGAWSTLTPTSNTCSSTGANTDCTIAAAPTGTASNYYQTDGSNYWMNVRVYQAPGASAITLKTNLFAADQPPLAPLDFGALQQWNATNTAQVPTAYNTKGTSFTVVGQMSDNDATDTLTMCVEVQLISVAFTANGVDTACGSPVAFSGSWVPTTVLVTGLVDGSSYHWRARVKDLAGQYGPFLAYGANSDVVTAAIDIIMDNTAPAVGTVLDGPTNAVDSTYNTGSLSSLSCNWSGFTDSSSGIASYDVSIGTSAGATDVSTGVTGATSGWFLGVTSPYTTASVLTLHTSQRYYCNVRATDAVGNVSATASSNGQFVAPTLTFTSTSAVNFVNLNSINSYTDSKTVNLTISTNAYAGYTVKQWATSQLTAGSKTVAWYSGTYAAPTTWSGTGFGYTTNDTSIASNVFATGTKYARFATTGPGDIVAQHTSAVAGTSISDTPTLTFKLVVPSSQTAGRYTTTVVYSCVATY